MDIAILSVYNANSGVCAMSRYFVVNPKSGSGHGKKIWDRTEAYLKSIHAEYEVYFTTGRGDAERKIRELTEEKHFTDGSSLIVIGGDGTNNEAINGFDLESGMLFGFIPGGSGNDLSRSLGVENETIEHTASMIEGNRTLDLDVGVLRLPDGKQRKFLVSAGISFDAAVCEHLERSRFKKLCAKMGCASLSYGIVGFMEYLKTKLLPCSVTDAEGKKYDFESTFFVSFQVHPFEGGGFKFAPAARWNDGKLEVCVTHAAPRIKLAPVILGGKGEKGLLPGPVVSFVSTEHAAVSFPEELYVHTDGEVQGKYKSLETDCLRGKLRMII